jgi:F420-0:gamma-glutamyl ligase
MAVGIRTPIIKRGDDLITIMADSVMAAVKSGNITLNDRDILGVTEAVLARAQGNYASIASIRDDIKGKMGTDEFSVVFPILSRNRFAVCLKGIAMAARRIHLILSYPADEVGNQLFDHTLVYDNDINPWRDAITLERYRELFGYPTHKVTGKDYVAFYKGIIEEYGAECEITFCNDIGKIVSICGDILLCSIHDREWQKKLMLEKGAKNVLMLSDIMNSGHLPDGGFNEQYGLLGSNTSTEETVKLFPRDCDTFISSLQKRLFELTGKQIEILIYGDGAFKDPVWFIWELADPVVSPAYSKGLEGMPNEMKLKYLADKEYSTLSGDELTEAVKKKVGSKMGNIRDTVWSLGTTPRRIIDRLGSLCDLTSGSGDKGTPIVYIQGYFDNFSN